MTTYQLSKETRLVSVLLGTLAVGTAVTLGLAQKSAGEPSVFAAGGVVLLWDGASGKVRRRAEDRAGLWVRWAVAIALASTGCLAAGVGHNPASNLPDLLGLVVWVASSASLAVVVLTVLVRIGVGLWARLQPAQVP